MKRLIVGIIIGILLTMSINFVGASISSSGILYNSKTLNTVLDDLYSKIEEINNTGNAASSDILSGKTALVKGTKITGTIGNYSGKHIWVNTDNGTFKYNMKYTYSDGSTTNEMVAFNSKQKGYFDNTTNFLFGTKSEIESMIGKGKTFLGITGTYTSENVVNNYEVIFEKGSTNDGSNFTLNKNYKYIIFTMTYTSDNNNPLDWGVTVSGTGTLVKLLQNSFSCKTTISTSVYMITGATSGSTISYRYHYSGSAFAIGFY